jgi:hypothetical protein
MKIAVLLTAFRNGGRKLKKLCSFLKCRPPRYPFAWCVPATAIASATPGTLLLASKRADGVEFLFGAGLQGTVKIATT